MGRDLQVSRNCKENSRNWGNLIANFFVRKKCDFLSYLSKMCVSTHEYHLRGVNVGYKLDFATATTPPPPVNRVGSWRSRKNPATTPPPTESRRLLEITEKTQEIQQPQLGSSDVDVPCSLVVRCYITWLWIANCVSVMTKCWHVLITRNSLSSLKWCTLQFDQL